jgi:hypothetical protein
VRVDEKLVTSDSGKDLGATYAKFYCETCRNTLGKVYRTTPRSLDLMRDYYTYQLSAITSYQLGGSSEGQEVEETPISLNSIINWQKRVDELEHIVRDCIDSIHRLETQVTAAPVSLSHNIQTDCNNVENIEKGVHPHEKEKDQVSNMKKYKRVLYN